MTIVNNSPGQVLTDIISTNEVTATYLPVASAPGAFRTMLRVHVPVVAGDVLDVDARARVTSPVSYPVGVSYHLWGYDVDTAQGSSGPWWRLGPSNGDNVFVPRHHMPLHISTVYTVPADWPVGHRIVVALRADAESTAWQAGDTVAVDPLGILTVRRWA